LAAVYYGKKSIEDAKSFILSLPPGFTGSSAMVNTLRMMPDKVPEMMPWLTQQVDHLGDDWVQSGIGTLTREWAENDAIGAASYLITSRDIALTLEQRASHI